MPNLANLVTNRLKGVVDFGELTSERVNIEVYLARLSGEMMIMLSELESITEQSSERQHEILQRLPETLAQLLASWDLTETLDDGSEQLIPITPERIAQLGYLIQWAIARGVRSARGEVSASGESASAKPSDAISSPTA